MADHEYPLMDELRAALDDDLSGVGALRRWVFNEFGITSEGAWTEEFDRLLNVAIYEQRVIALSPPYQLLGRAASRVLLLPVEEGRDEATWNAAKHAAAQTVLQTPRLAALSEQSDE